jgi:multiple antibiotic resistance protein
MEEHSLISMVLMLFVIIDPIGITPAVVALTKDFGFEKQRHIIIREVLLGFGIALFFQYFGDFFLNQIAIQDFALRIAGGILLFLVALEMIFPQVTSALKTDAKNKQDPFIFPIATPLLAGPGLLTLLMLLSRTKIPPLKITAAVTIAWIFAAIVLAVAPYLHRICGKAGLLILEQIMGLFLAFVALELFLTGVKLFINLY